MTLASKNANQFGVHLESSQVTLFEGNTFVPGNSSNVVNLLNKRVNINSINLAGGGVDVIFQRLTGETVQSGTVTMALVASTTRTKTVTIYGTGLFQTN